MTRNSVNKTKITHTHTQKQANKQTNPKPPNKQGVQARLGKGVTVRYWGLQFVATWFLEIQVFQHIPVKSQRGPVSHMGTQVCHIRMAKRGHSCSSGREGGIWLHRVQWGKRGHTKHVQERAWCQHHCMDDTTEGKSLWMGKHGPCTFVEVWGRKLRNGKETPIPLTIIQLSSKARCHSVFQGSGTDCIFLSLLRFTIGGDHTDYFCAVIGHGEVATAHCNGTSTTQNMCEKAANISRSWKKS